MFSGWTLLPPTTPPASGAAPPYLGREEQSSTRLPRSCCPPRLTQPLRLHCCPAGRTCSTFPRPPPSAQLSNHHLTLARVSRTREVHKPHQSPCFSPLPPASCRSHHYQGICAEPAGDQTHNAVEHQRCFSFTTFLMGQGCLS